VLEKVFGKSLLRSTWRVLDADEREVALVQERSLAAAVVRRAIDFVPDVGGLIPIPYNFDILVDGRAAGRMDRKFKLRDSYVLDLTGDTEGRIDRRLAIALAIGLDALQNR
jgi:DNA-binding transcriptional regulator LsrR (DeoR family)